MGSIFDARLLHILGKAAALQKIIEAVPRLASFLAVADLGRSRLLVSML